ncbi:hypothetical protein BUALT_Bualt06G0002600 [Buddleja alternifolia]|uniref:W2 domain-containing protein n=1 Tax=Buddleja alternifolia TaxID=168488 RepID=A0AAV6XCX8_9LAMI|nr:hypothetical protein BUALT_Bualt06G0002600 [Buddleja alternifolia]
MYKVQIQCYEDAKLMKLFPEIIRSLYDQDVLAEDTILHWFCKGTNPKGRQTFVKSLEPFVKWVEEAEEEEEVVDLLAIFCENGVNLVRDFQGFSKYC